MTKASYEPRATLGPRTRRSAPGTLSSLQHYRTYPAVLEGVMTDEQKKPESGSSKSGSGSWVGVGAVLGVGIGAAIGAGTGDLGTGIWIGAVIGVGLGLLMTKVRG